MSLPRTKFGWWLRDYRHRHLRIGRVRPLSKTGFRNFKIDKISWDVHWQTDLYLAVIIRDYLRFFIENTPAIGNTVIDDKYDHFNDTVSQRQEYFARWKKMVNDVADEFDELVTLIRDDTGAEWKEKMAQQRALQKKAFADLAEIFDELQW